MTHIEEKKLRILSAVLAIFTGTALSWAIWLWFPAKPVVEFEPFVLVSPLILEPGDELSLTYSVTRNDSCMITVEPRFFNRDTMRFDGEVRRANFETQSVASNDGELPFSIRLPENIYPGNWYYWPLISPGDDCRSHTAVTAPPAGFVVSAERPCRRIRGSATNRYYAPGHPLYSLVQRPVACFDTVEDARAAGYTDPDAGNFEP